MPFIVSCILFSLIPLGMAFLFGFVSSKKPDLYRSLPREKNVGILIGALCLIWSAWYVLPMLEGSLSRFQIHIKLLVPAVTILSYFFLNFILTRAVGGLMMLAATAMLHAAFVIHLPFRPVFSIFCYLIAVAGMFALAVPWRFRDLLKQSSESSSWRKGLTVGTATVGGILLVFAFLG